MHASESVSGRDYESSRQASFKRFKNGICITCAEIVVQLRSTPVRT